MKKERIAGFVPVWKIGGAVLALLMLVGISSCGDKKTEVTVSPVATSIIGPVGDVFQIVDKSRTLKVDGNCFTLNVGLKRTAEGSVKDVEWGFELLDENDEVLVSDEDIFSPKGKDTLEGLKVGEEGSLELKMYERMDDSDIKKISKFRVTSKAKKDWGSSSTVATEEVAEEAVAAEEVAAVEEVATEASSSSSEDWNKILDEYEKYCDKVVALAKKAQAGDISAMTEYASLLESAESLQKKLENAGSDLTAAQAARLNKIAAKMAKAMM
ncbi:MAG: hypothetical protein K2K75_00770 [Muribaculaceae bacterium]|nr:hypothetical protein [Muribaculaceae bacterium]